MERVPRRLSREADGHGAEATRAASQAARRSRGAYLTCMRNGFLTGQTIKIEGGLALAG